MQKLTKEQVFELMGPENFNITMREVGEGKKKQMLHVKGEKSGISLKFEVTSEQLVGLLLGNIQTKKAVVRKKAATTKKAAPAKKKAAAKETKKEDPEPAKDTTTTRRLDKAGKELYDKFDKVLIKNKDIDWKESLVEVKELILDGKTKQVENIISQEQATRDYMSGQGGRAFS